MHEYNGVLTFLVLGRFVFCVFVKFELSVSLF